MHQARLLIAALITMTPLAANADIIRFHHDVSFGYSSGDFSQFSGHQPSGYVQGWFELGRHDNLLLGSFQYRDFRYRSVHAWSALSRVFGGMTLRRGHSFDHASLWDDSVGDIQATDSYRYFRVDSRYTSDLASIEEPTSSSVSVPEPGTLGLLGAALAGIGLMRRRRPL